MPPCFSASTHLSPPPMDIQCYSLAYGVLGFISHFLTFYAALCLILGRNPLWPAKFANFTRIGLGLAVIAVITTTALTVLSMVRCRSIWQLSLMAVWKFGTSTSLSMITIHVAFTIIFDSDRPTSNPFFHIPSDDNNASPPRALWWGLLCTFLPVYLMTTISLISAVSMLQMCHP